MHGGDRRYGHGDLDDTTIRQLCELSRNSGGWYVWGDNDDDPRFVPINDWIDLFAAWSEANPNRV